MKGKTVVVTGGCGFIGSHIVDHLVREEVGKIIVVDNLWLYRHGHDCPVFNSPRVVMVVGDASNEDLMGEIFRKNKVDVVVNCAVMPLPHSIDYPVENFNNNVDITMNLLELEVHGAFNHLIHFSSSEVYGSCQTAPMDESHPIAPSTVYAASKSACDLLVMSYCKMYDTSATILRPFNNYGIRQNERTYAGVIPRTVNRLLAGQTIEIYGEGEQTRDYVYVDDTARAVIFLINNIERTRGEIYNLASGQETKINRLMYDIREIFMQYSPPGTSPVIHHLPGRQGDVMRHIGDAKKLKDLGFEIQTDLRVGLRNTILWYMNKPAYEQVQARGK